jgi:uncharacterized membrane protein
MRWKPRLSPDSPVSPVLWYAVLGPPAAWFGQFLIYYWLAETQCSPAGAQWDIPLATWAIVVGAVAAVIAAGAGLTSIALLRRNSDDEAEDAPPGGRIRFLAVVGMTLTPLFFAMILMTTAGLLTLIPCNQS